MKRHYSFIPIQDKDLCQFRKSAISGLLPRPAFAVTAIVILGLIAYPKQALLQSDKLSLIAFGAGLAVVLYFLIQDMQKLFTLFRLRKSSLIPYIRVRGMDSDFYIEEVENGFVVQTAPVDSEDILSNITLLIQMKTKYPEFNELGDLLLASMTITDPKQLNKSVMYTEIIFDQLAKGNKDILATYDKLTNFRDDIL